MSPSRVTAIHPLSAIEGGRITIEGSGFPVDGPILPEVRIGDARARVVFASPTAAGRHRPAGLEGGRAPVRVGGGPVTTAFVDIAAPFATGLHQVDNPVFDRDGNLYVTYSGTRGQQVPVSIFRVRPNGTRETFSSGIVNPTSMAIDPQGRLYVSSRFEGTVYRVAADGSVGAVRDAISAWPAGCVRAGRHALRRRSIRHDLPRRPRRPRDHVRVAAGERGGVSPRDRPRPRAVRHRPDARRRTTRCTASTPTAR